MEEIAKSIALRLSIAIEILGALVIGIGLIRFLYGYVATFGHSEHGRTSSRLRVRLGSSLTLALELLLAADILQTAVAPTWDDIGKLAAIAAIRTVLNYFLEKELRQMEDGMKGTGGRKPADT